MRLIPRVVGGHLGVFLPVVIPRLSPVPVPAARDTKQFIGPPIIHLLRLEPARVYRPATLRQGKPRLFHGVPDMPHIAVWAAGVAQPRSDLIPPREGDLCR